MKLDTPTIAVISIVIDFALTMTLLHAWCTRTTYSGFGAWIGSILCWSVGSTLVLLLSDFQPRFIPKIIGISLILLHPILIYEGIKRFYGLRIRWWGTQLREFVPADHVCPNTDNLSESGQFCETLLCITS